MTIFTVDPEKLTTDPYELLLDELEHVDMKSDEVAVTFVITLSIGLLCSSAALFTLAWGWVR